MTSKKLLPGLGCVLVLSLPVLAQTKTSPADRAFMQMAARAAPNIGLILYNILTSIVFNMLGATGVAMIYFELRRVKEGVAPQALVDTFS